MSKCLRTHSQFKRAGYASSTGEVPTCRIPDDCIDSKRWPRWHGADLAAFVALYNHQLPQSALGSKPPMQAMKNWHQEYPFLFHKRPYDRPGCDTYPLPLRSSLPTVSLRRVRATLTMRYRAIRGAMALSGKADIRPTNWSFSGIDFSGRWAAEVERLQAAFNSRPGRSCDKRF